MLPNLLSSAGYLLVTFLNAWALGGADSRFRYPAVGSVSAHRQHLGAFSAPGSGKAQALRASWELSRMSRMSRMKTNRAWATCRIAMGVTCS